MTKRLLALTITVGLVASAPAAAVAPGANGKLLYTLQTTGNFDIWGIEADGTGNAPLITSLNDDQGGSWSPDGTKIVFASERTGAGDIYVADANGLNEVRLTTDPAAEAHPSFSPDGQKIVFVRKDPDEEIFVMNADGSGVERRTDNAVVDAGPEWSPDGTRIAFFRANVIHVMNADGSDQHVLVPGGNSVGPQWSPDARFVLFKRNDGGVGHAYVVNADGSGLMQVGPATQSVQAPSWSPDGRRIVFLSGGGTGSDIWIMNADGTGAAPILDDALIRSGPRWQPIPRGPSAVTQPAGGISSIAARLNGTIDSTVLHPTTYWFEYGTTTAYGSRTPDAAAPAPVGAQSVSADIAGLKPAATYHFRVVARNAIGTTAGLDATFQAAKATPRSLTVGARPRRDRKLPFRYVISGRLRLPASVTVAEACRGTVTIQLKRGKRKIATRRTKVSRSCRYRKAIAIKSTRRLRASKGRITVTTSFGGNAVLSTRRGAARVVRFG